MSVRAEAGLSTLLPPAAELLQGASLPFAAPYPLVYTERAVQNSDPQGILSCGREGGVGILEES